MTCYWVRQKGIFRVADHNVGGWQGADKYVGAHAQADIIVGQAFPADRSVGRTFSLKLCMVVRKMWVRQS
jgi:hypothetical protein